MQLNKEDFYTVMLFAFSVLLITYMGVELMHSVETEKTTAAQSVPTVISNNEVTDRGYWTSEDGIRHER